MSDENPSILHHVSLGTRDFAAATAFYDAVLETIGCRRVLDFPGGVGYGKQFPEFWVQAPLEGEAGVANGTHFAFVAPSRAAVDAFHATALGAGAADAGAPGLRPDYGPGYYACFVLDLDGHKIEAAVIPD